MKTMNDTIQNRIENLRFKVEHTSVQANRLDYDKKYGYNELLHELNVYNAELMAQTEHLIETENKNQELEDSFKQLFYNSPTAYIVIDRHLNIFNINNKALNLFELKTRDECKLLNFMLFKHYNSDKDSVELKMNFFSWILNNHDDSFVLCYQAESEKFLKLNKSSLNQEQILISIDDISELKKLELKLMQSNQELKNLNQALEEKVKHRTIELSLEKDKAESANKAKSEFLSCMSHDLRTPLNAILGYAQLFENDQSLDHKYRANATEMMKSGNHLLSLINEVLDLSKIESGHLKLNIKTINLKDLIEDCVASVKPLLQSKQVTITPETSNCLEKNHYIQADPIRLKQVIINLISNAVKYNHTNGYVKISCSHIDNRLRIHIKDNGIGISKENLSQLFKPFSRFDSEHSETEGTGLGLVIVKQLIELMGGNIGVDSEIGKGSEFWFELHLDEQALFEQPKEQEYPPIDDHSMTSFEYSPIEKNDSIQEAKILVAEDNLANQEVLKQQLELIGYTADYVDNGLEALNQLEQEDYHLLMTDIQMPMMNGYELVKKIREIETNSKKHLPVIAFTASVLKEDVDKCMAAGMDDVITKPIKLKELEQGLPKWLKSKTYIYNKK